MSGYASAEAKGFPVVSPTGISAYGQVSAFDGFVVKSGSLPRGTPISLRFDLSVEGSGIFFANYHVKQLGSGLPSNDRLEEFELSLSGSDFNGIGGSDSKTISARVGDQYTLF